MAQPRNLQKKSLQHMLDEVRKQYPDVVLVNQATPATSPKKRARSVPKKSDKTVVQMLDLHTHGFIDDLKSFTENTLVFLKGALVNAEAVLVPLGADIVNELCQLAKSAGHLKLVLHIDTEDESIEWQDLLGDATKRDAFIKSVMATVDSCGIHGIAIDLAGGLTEKISTEILNAVLQKIQSVLYIPITGDEIGASSKQMCTVAKKYDESRLKFVLCDCTPDKFLHSEFVDTHGKQILLRVPTTVVLKHKVHHTRKVVPMSWVYACRKLPDVNMIDGSVTTADEEGTITTRMMMRSLAKQVKRSKLDGIVVGPKHCDVAVPKNRLADIAESVF